MAEIISENVVYKILEILKNQDPGEYENLSIDDFYTLHNRFMKDFNPIAHEIQLSNQELEDIKLV
ncbi:MAG: hypothetical protein QME42_07835 [bacterium]|nr:hypothetical protein [bacterium]